MGTYEEWLAKKRKERAAGNSSGSSGSPQSAQSAYEAWVAKKSGEDATDWWKKSGIEDMDIDFWAFAKDERRWLEQGAFSRQYSSNAERWRDNIAQERAWLEKYGARLGDNAQRISDALDGYEETLNYYDSLYAATAEYEKAGQKISDYITAGVDPAQIDMAGLLQGKANVSSGATVVLATDQYSKAQEQLMQSFQPFASGTAMDKDNQAALGKEVSGQKARTKMALAWLDQHQKELGEETYQGLKGYYENTLTQLDLMDSTIQWYADGKSAAVYQDMGEMIRLFQEGKAPTAELAQQEESLYAEVQALQDQVDTWQQQYDDMREAVNEGRISEKNLQAAQENLQWSRDNLRGYQQMLAQKEQELQEVQEREAFYWALATNPQTADEDAAAVIERGQIRYADEMGAFNRAWNARADEIVAENPDEEMAIPRAEAQAKKEARQRYTVAVDSSHMTEEEKQNFYYLLGSGNDQLAIEYANATSVERRRELMAKWTEHASGANVLPATVAYSLLFPLAGADLLSAGYDVNTGLNQSSDIGPGGIRDAIVQGAVNTLNNDGKLVLPSDIPVLGGKGLGDLYSMALSGAESRGAAMAFGQYATLFLGLSAASSTYNQAVLNGADPEEAKLQAVSAGVFEALFESLSIGQFLDGKVTGSAVKDALIAAGVEASEETMTSIANEIADRMINQDQSQWEQTIARYRKEGMSREEAEDRAWRELVDTIAWDTVAGGLIGGVMGSGQTVQVYKNADAYIAMQNSENAAEQAMYQAAMIAAKVEADDSAEVTRKKVAQWVKEGRKGFGLALKNVVAGKASFEKAAETVEDEETAQETQAEAQPAPAVAAPVKAEATAESQYYRKPGERFEIPADRRIVDQTEVLRYIAEQNRESIAQMSNQQLAESIDEQMEIRDDESADDQDREMAQMLLDVMFEEQGKRYNNEGGVIRAEVSDEGGQWDDGLGTGRQAGAVAEGTSRPVAGSEKKAQGAVLSNLRENGTARSAEEIGVFQGSSEKNLYVLQDSDIAQSAQWKRIRENAEADGARVVLYAGDLKVYNPNTKEYSKVEGIHQVNGKGELTYYIKADGRFRDAEQVYKHEKFHEIVDNNPELMGDLMLVLQMNYTKQEIARLVNQYIEAYEGIYGVYEEGMTEEELYKLEMEYLEEIFADVYGDIQRGKIRTAMAKKALGDQTDAVQRAAQNLRGIKNKKAPPKQSFSITQTDIDNLRAVGRKSVNEFTSEEIKSTEKWARKFYAELGTKSPFFRRWFGDWREYDSKTKIPYIPINTEFTSLSDIKRGSFGNKDTNWSIDVSRRGVEETANKKGKNSAEYRAIKDLTAVIENAVLLDTVAVSNPSKNMGKDAVFVHHLYCPVKTASGKGIAKLYVGESFTGGHKFFLTKIEKVSSDRSFLNHLDESTLGATNTSDDTVISIADIYKFVKGNDDAYERDSKKPVRFTPKSVNPVLLNEDWTPKVFYHGTGERFTAFSPDEISPVEGSFFFAENREDAQGYGENVMEVYLTGNNLADYDNQPREFYRLRDKKAQVQWLKERGYDGWYADMDSGGWGEVSVFSPGQIKSATNNIGTFDEKKADIRYSMAEDKAELDAEYARKMAEDEEDRRGKTAPEWETVRQSLDAYNAAAVEEKEKRAEKASISNLKNRIEKNEQLLRQLSDMITMARKSNYLSKAMAENVEMRKGIIQETLEIDRKALKAKQEAKKQEEKTRREKKQEEEIREQKARIATEELADKLMDIFYTRKGAKWETRAEIIEIADRIVKDGRITTEIRDEFLATLYKNSEVTAEADPYFSDVRKYVNGVRLYVSDEVKAEFGEQESWNAFKKKAFGNRIYLTNDEAATAIDIFTQELAELFGGEFTEDADLKTQLERIVKLAEEGKAEKLSLAEMMQRMYNEEGWSVEDQMDELERRLDKELEKFSEKASVEIRLRQKSIKAMLEDRANFRKTLEIQRENRANSALMEQVRKRMHRLMKYRNRTTPSVRKMIDEQIGDLDTLARQISPNGIENLQQLLLDYGTVAEELGEGFVPNPDIEARLKRLNQRHLADMTVDEIRELGEALSGIITQINNYNQMVSLERKELVSDMANKAQRELEATKGAKNDNWLHQYLQGHLDAKRFFGKISGWANGAWEQIGESLSKGEEKARRYRMEAMALFEDFLANKENRKWLKKAAGEKALWETVEVPGAQKIDGSRIDSIQLTPMMKVSLLMHSQNNDNLRHIGYWQKEGDTYGLKGGGVTIPDQKLYRKGKIKEAYNKGEVIRIPPEVVKKIAASCTEQEKAFAKLLTKYFDGMSKNAINEVSLVVDGWERAKVTNYFPIESDKAFVVTENDLIKQDLSLQGIGSLKERSHIGANPVYLFDATDALFRNIQQVSQYYGLTLPLRDLNAVMNATYYKTTKSESAGQAANPENELLKRVKAQEGWGSVTIGSVEKTLIKKWGESAKDYIHKLSKNLQNTRGDKDAGSEILAKLRGNYARAVISFNPSSVLKQMSSYPVALAYLDAGDLIAGLFNDHFKNAKKAVNTLSKYSAVYWHRNQGNTRVELSEVMARKQFGEGIPLGYNWTQGMDSAVTRRLLAACMHHVEKTGLQQGSQESVENGTDRYWTEVAKLFNKVVLNTQSNTSVMERPELTRADPNNIIRFLTMFRTDAFQQFNMLTEAKGRMKAAKEAYKADSNERNKKRLKEARKFATKTVSGIIVGQAVVAAITNLLALALFRDKDFWDEEGEFMWGEFLKSIAFDLVEGLAGFIAGLDWIWSSIAAAIEDEKWYGPEISPIELLTDAWTSFMNLAKAGFKIDGKDAKKQFHDFVKNFALALGIPLGNVEKYFVAGMRWFAPEAAEKYNNMVDEITKADLPNYSPRLADEAIGVIMDNRTDDLSDADKAEIVRLYKAGETTAVPGGIPTSFSYTTEDGEEVTVAMSPKQREEYRDAWNKVVSGNLHSLLNLEGYQEANDEEKATYIEKLYKYANQIAQNTVDPNKEPEKWVQQGENAKKEGIAVFEYVVFRVDLNDITGKDEKGESVEGMKANRSMELLESMGWTDSQERNVYFDVLGTKSDGELTGDGKEMQGLLDAGLSWNDANNVVTMFGKKKDRINAIANLNVSDKTKAAAMMVYGTDKEKKLFDAGVQFGVSFADYNEVIQKADADGTGSVSQEEAETYIRTMGLGWTEMAYLWQMVTDGKDGASNPFGEYWGAEFYEYAHRNDEKK